MHAKDGVLHVLGVVHVDAFVSLHTCGMRCKSAFAHFRLPSFNTPLNPTTLFLRPSFLFSRGAHFLLQRLKKNDRTGLALIQQHLGSLWTKGEETGERIGC